MLPAKESTLREFVRAINQEKYPWLASETPKRWVSENMPIRLVWDDAVSINLAVSFAKDIKIAYADVEGYIKDVAEEYKLYPEEYPCGLLTAIVLPIVNYDDIQLVDNELISSPDVLIAAFYKGTIITLEKKQGKEQKGSS